jgi:hypothetical protein
MNYTVITPWGETIPNGHIKFLSMPDGALDIFAEAKEAKIHLFATAYRKIEAAQVTLISVQEASVSLMGNIAWENLLIELPMYTGNLIDEISACQ